MCADQLTSLPACLPAFCPLPCAALCCAVPPHCAPNKHPPPQIWELMYDTVDATHDCVRIATGVLSTLTINPDRMMKVGGSV
jgi:hypothetical protein